MEILYVYGKDNSGKTTAMLWALDAFVHAREQQIGNGISEFDLSNFGTLSSSITTAAFSAKIRTNIGKMGKGQYSPDDVGCTIQVGQRMVGFASEGDYTKRMKPLIKYFRNVPCDFVVMAVNEKCLPVFKTETKNDYRESVNTNQISKGKSYVNMRQHELIRTSLEILTKMLQKCP